MPDDMMLNSKGKPFATKTYAEKFLPDGYVAVERDGGWVGVGQPVVDFKDEEPTWYLSHFSCNQCTINETLSDAELTDLEPDEPKEPEPDYSGKDVICPGCGLSHHQTTEDYNPDKNANLSMLRLKKKYRAWGWEEMPRDPHSGYGCLVCPECGAALAPSGKLRVRD
ncbi:hypothetical protein [Desulfobacter postgatei]|uniref:hypothetical protein n=1 Tax=Desulfobacter postgatei TaxID=2293 RepID=UPI00259BA182|nr:hypothetical protein [uncultured Desulfobacter sp.]